MKGGWAAPQSALQLAGKMRRTNEFTGELPTMHGNLSAGREPLG